ncbi:MAG: FGGY family carbohydrate kinase [Phycisphaeraceae bacterium]
MSLVVGIDIGTQGTKAALFDADGACLAEALVASQLHRPKPGVVEEDPERQVDSVCKAVRKCLKDAKADAGDVVGVGIDGQMAGVIGVGRDGQCVTPYDSWLDTRCAPYIKKMEQQAGDEVLAKTGCVPSFNHGPKKLWWKHERKAAYRKIAAFVQPGGYAAMRLCGLTGEQAFIDTTYLHFSGFADNQRGRWDEGLCEQFGLDMAKLPRIVKPQEVVGQVTATMAKRCGLKAGTCVVAGCGDTAASFLAAGATQAGVCVDVAGTASVFAATTGKFRADVKQRVLACGRSAVPGLWHPYAYINGGGMNLEWFREQVASAGKRRGGMSLTKLNELAEAVAVAADNPMFVPHLGGRVSPPQPNLRGAWIGLSWDHTLGHLYRAVLEGVAMEYAVYKDVLGGLYRGAAVKELRVTGGGEKSGLWNTIKSDALQTPVRRIERSFGAPAGAAMLAAWGVGLVGSLEQIAADWVALSTATKPQRRLAKHYQNRAARYQKLLNVLDE